MSDDIAAIVALWSWRVGLVFAVLTGCGCIANALDRVAQAIWNVVQAVKSTRGN